MPSYKGITTIANISAPVAEYEGTYFGGLFSLLKRFHKKIALARSQCLP
jgi:hypothetical protein